ncbi:MAG: hypothetical protein ABSE16_18145 [Verrucomicrobiota bacterium]
MKKRSLKLFATALCTVALSTGIVSVGHANIAFSPTGLTLIGADEGYGNDGEFFTPTENISVTALGYVAPGTGGNLVGIFDVASDTLLTSTTVTTSDPVVPLVNGFYYQSIAPLMLTAGVQYAVVGFFADNGALGYDVNGSMDADPAITFDGYKYDYTAEAGGSSVGLDLPTIGYSPPIEGPNFQFDVVPVPEASTMIAGALLILPFGASALRILRRRYIA